MPTAPPSGTHATPTTELFVTGMTCGNCARHVTEAIQSVPGVRSAAVSLDARQASVRWAPEAPQNIPALVRAVATAGYTAKVIEAHEHGPARSKLAGWQLTLWVGVAGTLFLMIGEWVFGLGLARWFQWVSFAVASVVQGIAGAPFYRGAWNQLKARSSNMDTLVALGSTTAFGYSAWALLGGHGGHLYFMEAAAIIALISAGHWIESRVSAKASSALRQLLNLAPQTARRINSAERGTPAPRVSASTDPQNRSSALHGAEEEVPVAELKIGDLAALRPGDRVPTDGIVVEGVSAVDESMLTGESAPVDKTAGAEAFAGTVNLNGRLVLRVTATGDATALAHIIAAVQRAQSSRANIQRLGDRVSNVFVPIVVVIALAAGLWWGLAQESALKVFAAFAPYLWTAHPPSGAAAGFIIAAAVLIVACPCAMGLATPAAIMAGSNAAAQRGILIRDGVALEKAGDVTVVLFDKTGTLTTGELAVAGPWIIPNAELSTKHAEQLAAALARPSNHPISQAVARLSPEAIEFTDWQELPGAGVQANWQSKDGRRRAVRLGSLRWLKEHGAESSAGSDFFEFHSGSGATLIGLAVDNSLNALFALKHSLKPGAAEVVARLHRQGFRTFMVTGDSPSTAAGIARLAGIPLENVFAEVRPEQKAARVKQLQQQGERVAFVGDGINDAPALEQADLGIAVSRASDIAREAADIILLKSEIEAVPEALGLARATLRTIRQNLFWAFFYNAVGVPLAAMGFMSPVLCAAAMGFSDLIVIGNALRLRRFAR